MTESTGGKTIDKEAFAQKVYACWLDTIYWISSQSKYRLLEAAEGIQEIYHMPEQQVQAVMGKRGCERFMQHRERFEPEAVWNYLARQGISYTYCQAADFPRRLTEIPDPPFGLFYKGRLPSDTMPAVAVIGARKCSEYGRCMAEQFAAGFAARGINVISGMAMGIDGISQSAALKAGGSSYAVLGGGVDIVYPRTNETLYAQLVRQGGVLSEYPPRLAPRPSLFPPRNRIISALSDVVLVVEAREKSGTLITVDMALEQGREVYTIPGRCTDSLSMGCNRLLRQGAMVATAPEDIIEDQRWESLLTKPPDSKAPAKASAVKLSPAAQEVYSALDMLPSTQDEIVTKLRAQKSICTIPQICQGLVELELKGLAACQNGQYQRRCVF
ncbi:MAG: DNA-protecting protein DprA [Lachnospiraceae bacterium]|nr:DNA-protecting protein DprA [Lachnospiraceae bacterium]